MMPALYKHSCNHVNKHSGLLQHKRTCMVQDVSTLGDRLRETREAMGWSQGEVVARLKKRFRKARMSQQNLAQLEAGETQSTGYMVELALTLRLNPVWLASGEGDKHLWDTTAMTTEDAKASTILENLPSYKKHLASQFLDTLAKSTPGDGGEGAVPVSTPKRKRPR